MAFTSHAILILLCMLKYTICDQHNYDELVFYSHSVVYIYLSGCFCFENFILGRESLLYGLEELAGIHNSDDCQHTF